MHYTHPTFVDMHEKSKKNIFFVREAVYFLTDFGLHDFSIKNRNDFKPTNFITTMKNSLLMTSALMLFLPVALVAQIKDPKLTEVWYPEPAVVTPSDKPDAPPSDAIVLFDGKDLSHWHKPKYSYGGDMKGVATTLANKLYNQSFTEAEWIVENGEMIVKPGSGAIETKQSFGDVQLHVEWLAPIDEGKEGQAYSNSGIFLMGLYEVQVLNSYKNKTYPNGQAGAVYKQYMPLVNASRPPGEWQKYDIIFHAPRFNDQGEVTKPAKLMVFHNGVLIQNNIELKGPAIYIGQPFYVAHPPEMPLILQDHGDKVRFKNIWVRPL